MSATIRETTRLSVLLIGAAVVRVAPALQGAELSGARLAAPGPVLAVCHECRLSWVVRNCTRDEGGPFELRPTEAELKPPLTWR
jgi:hypothetical protein